MVDRKYIFILLGTTILLGILLLEHPARADVTVNTTVNKNQIAVSDQLEVTVEMEWEQSEGNDIFVVNVKPPSCRALELVDSKESTSSKLTAKGYIGTRTLKYVFKAKEAGHSTIDPVLIQYISSPDQKEPTVKRGEPIEITIVSRAEGHLKNFLNFLAATVGLLIFGGAFAFLWRRGIFRPRPKKRAVVSDLHLENEKLGKLKEIKMYQVSGDVTLLYTDVTNLLAEYIEAKFVVSIRNKPEDEFKRLAQSRNIPQELRDLYLAVLRTAEHVRFGGLYPSRDEQDKFLRDVELYFKSLIPKNSEEEAIETVD